MCANKNSGVPKNPAQWLGLRPHSRTTGVPPATRTDSVIARHSWEPIALSITPARKEI